MSKVVGIKFKNTPKVYYFAPKEGVEIEENDIVVVETVKGVEHGTVVFAEKEVAESEIKGELKPILRKATKKDLETIKKNEEKAVEAIKIAEEKVNKLGLNMKLVSCEFALDGKKVLFQFTADNRVDFRELVKELASTFKVRIELRQVGIRDETKLLGGIAPCGRVCCCAGCMSDFQKVSIKMAKTQGLSLNPGKISGLCGRLMCCLAYENEHYTETSKLMPKVGGKVTTPDGEATVVSNQMLLRTVKVKFTQSDGAETYRDYDLADIKFKKGNPKETEKENDEELSDEMKKIID